MDDLQNANAAQDDYTVGPFVSRFKENLQDFCGFESLQEGLNFREGSGNVSFVPQTVFHKRDFHLKAHFYLDDSASAEEWLDWASAVG